MLHLLDNITWHTLSGAQARFANGAEDVRHYARGFSPIVGFLDPDKPNFGALSRFCKPGEHFYCEAWTGQAPAGWRIEAESSMSPG